MCVIDIATFFNFRLHNIEKYSPIIFTPYQLKIKSLKRSKEPTSLEPKAST